MSYSEYKNRRKNVNSVLDKLKKSNDSSKKDYSDDRFYEWKADDVGNAKVVIRFLPSCNDLPPVISRFRHSFQKGGKYYIENCPTSIGKKCPLCEQNSDLCDAGQKEQCTGRFRRKEYFANILVVKDAAAPENEGKVFLYKFGQTIYDKLLEKLQPEDDDVDPIDIFDFETGMNFTLNICRKKGFANYDKSSFKEASAIEGGDEKYEEIFGKILPLGEFREEKQFKDYDKLKDRLSKVLGAASVNMSLGSKVDEEINENVEQESSDNDTNNNESSDSNEDADVGADDLDEFFKKKA